MKKISATVIVACATLAISMPINATCNSLSTCKPIEISVQIFNPGGLKPHKPKSPVRKPNVYIEDNILYLESLVTDCTLQLKSGNDVIYEMPIPAYNQEVQLPEHLTGHYDILLIIGDYCFIGEITLQ